MVKVPLAAEKARKKTKKVAVLMKLGLTMGRYMLYFYTSYPQPFSQKEPNVWTNTTQEHTNG